MRSPTLMTTKEGCQNNINEKSIEFFFDKNKLLWGEKAKLESFLPCFASSLTLIRRKQKEKKKIVISDRVKLVLNQTTFADSASVIISLISYDICARACVAFTFGQHGNTMKNCGKFLKKQQQRQQ